MQYFSTNHKSSPVSFRNAVLNGQPDDKGLYFPTTIAKLADDVIGKFKTQSNEDIAFEVIKPYVGGDISDNDLHDICRSTVSFDFPLVKITENITALELFHGPTLAFKDVGAKFMSQCLGHFSDKASKKTVVIVATSGDTGGAVANGFYGAEGVDVVILYPKGRVSRIQELQLTTLGHNVITLEVHGTFDDCQAIAKTALADESLKKNAFLTSANSINVARWLPQQFYYWIAYKNWEGQLPVISVPSGNFGNVTAGMIAAAAGLPVDGFIAASNANDVVPRYFVTGNLEPKPTIPTISNAMDVGNPSNFVRMLELFENSVSENIKDFTAVSITDQETTDTMKRVFDENGYILDPHGAVAFLALERHISNRPGSQGIFLETAHPVKFDSVKEILGTFGEVPSSVAELETKEKHSIEINADYGSVKELLLNKIL